MNITESNKLIKKPYILVIAGPTAVGKTEYAIELAEMLDGEIVSCDSMQLYKFMDIGSAKPTKEELSRVTHHLIDVIDPREEFSVARYQKLAKEAIFDILKRDKLPIIAGGTGLYLNSIIYDMDFSTPPEDGAFGQFRQQLYNFAEKEGAAALYQKLVALDPARAIEIHPNNIKKVIRAMEAITLGNGIKSFSNVDSISTDYQPVMICLNRNRNQLYERINLRVDMLMKKGLISEVKSLFQMDLSSRDISMKGIGYKEILSHLDGKYSEEEATELIKRNTRRFAKRQITWFKRYKDMHWINLSEFDSKESAIKEVLKWIPSELQK